MKKDIHPENFRPVIFHDSTSGEQFLIGSIVNTEEQGKWTDGKEYPLFRVEISSASHPFYTGKDTLLDRAGRVEKFKTKILQSKDMKEALVSREKEKKARVSLKKKKSSKKS